MTEPIRHHWRASLYNWLIHQWAGGGYSSFLFLTASVVVAAVLLFAALFHGLAQPATPFWPCVERAFLSFVTLGSDGSLCPGRFPRLDRLLEMLLLFLALFFFAAVVAYFTALVVRPKRTIHFKSALNIRKDADGCHRLICSLYTAPVTVTGLHIRIVARIRSNENTIKNLVIREGAPHQPMAEPWIPLRILADLNRNGIRVVDTDAQHFVRRMVYHDEASGRELKVESFHVSCTGVMADVDQNVYGGHWYDIGERTVYYGRHAAVEPDYDLARCSSGWRKRRPPVSMLGRFEGNDTPLERPARGCFLFGYGSLVDPASLARTLGRGDWTIEDFPLARLKGYRRIWGVAMDNRVTIPGY